jgi:hypothetical protein
MYFTDHEMHALRQDLHFSSDDRYTLALLHALEQVGDEEAIPLVRSLAKDPGSRIGTILREEAARKIQASARRCLAALEQRAVEGRDRNRLLRPAAAAVEDVLLRPAGSSQTDAALLPRVPSEGAQAPQVGPAQRDAEPPVEQLHGLA